MEPKNADSGSLKPPEPANPPKKKRGEPANPPKKASKKLESDLQESRGRNSRTRGSTTLVEKRKLSLKIVDLKKALCRTRVRYEDFEAILPYLARKAKTDGIAEELVQETQEKFIVLKGEFEVLWSLDVKANSESAITDCEAKSRALGDRMLDLSGRLNFNMSEIPKDMNTFRFLPLLEV